MGLASLAGIDHPIKVMYTLAMTSPNGDPATVTQDELKAKAIQELAADLTKHRSSMVSTIALTVAIIAAAVTSISVADMSSLTQTIALIVVAGGSITGAAAHLVGVKSALNLIKQDLEDAQK